MDIIQLSIRQPVSTFAGVILVVLFGVLGLTQLPVQLTPDVEAPTITVTTNWPGATPYEIEKEVVDRQEEVLKSIVGLQKLESSSYNGFSEVILTFKVGANLDAVMTRVANKLNEVKRYPDNADKPIISASGSESAPVIWSMLKLKDGDFNSIVEYRTFFENEVRHILERVPGVGSLFVFGGTEQRLEIIASPEKLARHGISIREISERINSANANVSAGVLGVGRRNYRVRTLSQYESPDAPQEIVLKDDGIHRVYLADVATTQFGFYPNPEPVIHNNTPMIVIGVRKEAGANVLELTERMREQVNQLNEGLLKRNNLWIDWVYDQTPYINNAIDNVRTNLLVGGILAIIVLWTFLRSFSSTITVAIAIPISAIGTFIFMYFLDRNINVVSLAGISFAVGMLVDNAIVVLENIDRHRSLGKNAYEASYHGASEVWGAVLASTATTVAVFLPVIFIEEEAGQLFRDIAIAITFSIILSLLVSVSVIPAITRQFYGIAGKKQSLSENSEPKAGHGIDKGNQFVQAIMRGSRYSLSSHKTQFFTVAIFTAISLLLVIALMPKAEYLPQGNRNLVLNILIPPPGFSQDKRNEMGNYIMNELKPYREEDGKDGYPQIRDLFYVASDRVTLFGGLSEHETRARELMPLFTRVMNDIPDVFGVSLQFGIFDNGIGKGRSVDVNISGEDYPTIVAAASMLYGSISQAIPGSQIRPVPSLEIGYPEANLIPDRHRILANGLSEEELGIYVDVLMDGRKIGEYKPSGDKLLDMVLTSGKNNIEVPEDLLEQLIATTHGELLRIGDLASIEYTQGMTQVDHMERKRNVRLQVTPPEDVALQTALETIEYDLLKKLAGSPQLTPVDIKVGGNADKLTLTRQALQWNFILAIVITYLLLSALFGNFLYPFIILFTVPLAAAGGFIGLSLVNLLIAPQPFDILVMLGFIILVGTVVNNAILIVHQSLNNVRHHDLRGKDAILASVRTRIRPIFMSATTSLFGLLPLVLATGQGSELYRGLGSVILGGLALSTMLTLFVVPAMLAFFIRVEKPSSVTN